MTDAVPSEQLSAVAQAISDMDVPGLGEEEAGTLLGDMLGECWQIRVLPSDEQQTTCDRIFRSIAQTAIAAYIRELDHQKFTGS